MLDWTLGSATFVSRNEPWSTLAKVSGRHRFHRCSTMRRRFGCRSLYGSTPFRGGGGSRVGSLGSTHVGGASAKTGAWRAE